MSPLENSGSRFMPFAGTDIASNVDALYGFLMVASFISCVLVIGGMIVFAVKYRRQSDNDKTPYISHNTTAEFLWSFIPFVIFMIAFVWGWKVFHDLRSMPTDALEITANAKKWSWEFVYKNGRRSPKEFYVPVNQPVKMVMTSADVIHSFYVPAFRNKQDVVPGRYSAFWFNPHTEGTYNIFCTEYCGDQHSGMLAKVHVVSREKYDEWLGTEPYKGMTPAQVGQKIYQGVCVACHSLDGTKMTGPTFKGIWGRQEKIAGGGEVTVDENYVRESIVNPAAKIVEGYPAGVMPAFPQLTDEELMGVIEFLKTVK